MAEHNAVDRAATMAVDETVVVVKLTAVELAGVATVQFAVAFAVDDSDMRLTGGPSALNGGGPPRVGGGMLVCCGLGRPCGLSQLNL